MYVIMGTKTIAVSDQVYERLRSLKREEESFTDLLDRLAGRPALAELASLLSREQAAKVRQSIEQGRGRSRARRERMLRP